MQPSLEQLKTHALQALAKQDFQSAKTLGVQMLQQSPQYADAYYVLAMVAGLTGQFGAAVSTMEKALHFKPERADYNAQMARFLLPLGHFRASVEYALKAYDIGPKGAFQLDTVGCVLSQTGFQKKADEMFSKAVSEDPNNAQYYYNYGSNLRFTGSFNKAHELLEKSIELEPLHYHAHWTLSILQKQTENKNHIDRLKALNGRLEGNPDAQSFVEYALGKEYEDLEDYGQAFHHYANGAEKRRSVISYDSDTDKQLIANLIDKFDADYMKISPIGYGDAEPIFIVGLPRTGTTLVERIISSHSEVMSAGELLNFGITTKLMAGVKSQEFLDTETIRQAAGLDPCVLGQAYHESTAPLTAGSCHYIDKLPFNFLYLGLIAKALPSARIIHVKRGAMDTCFSMFKQRFAMAYNYSYSFKEVAAYYGFYRQLMEHWKRLLGDRITEVSYESLVQSSEVESRALIKACGLEWQDSCLEFHKNTSAVSTASASQVREPIYATSLEKWRKFESHLTGLKAELEPYL